MTRHSRLLGFLCAGALGALGALGCGDDPSADASSAVPAAAASTPGLGASTSASTAPSHPRAPEGPSLVVRESFGASTRFFPLERAVLACEGGCLTAGGAKAGNQDTFVVDRKGSKKVPLFPESKWRAMYSNNQDIFADPRAVTFTGSYPEKLFASIDAPYDRGGYGNVSALVAGASGWEPSGQDSAETRVACHLSASAGGYFMRGAHCDDGGLDPLARKLLPRLVRVKDGVSELVVLADGSGVALLASGYVRLGSDSAAPKAAPWAAAPSFAVSLEDGSFVVAAPEGVFRVSAEDEIGRAVFRAASAPEAAPIADATGFQLVPVGSEVWVALTHGNATALAAPDEASAWKRFLPPTPSGERPNEARHDLPNAVKLTDACTTPFVTIASNNSPGYVFRASTEAFYGHAELQDALTFIQIDRGAATYFGAQAKTLDAAEAAMKIAKDKRFSPQLSCLDALGHIPDPTDPPGGVRVYFANLAAGQLLSP